MSGMYIFLLFLAIVIVSAVGIYNRLIRFQNNREQAFADIDVQLRQRHDLIPQLVEAVKGYMKHEKTVLTDITNARAQAMEARSINDKIATEAVLSQALTGLRVAVEAYPDLKANKNFIHLQEEIADVENKLAAARRFFNSATKELNNVIESFPSSLVANAFGFKEEKMFELGDRRASMEEPPKIDLKQP